MTERGSSIVFDETLVRQRLLKARKHVEKNSDLFDSVAEQLIERVGDVARPFHKALDLSPFPFLNRQKDNAFEVETPQDLPDENHLPTQKDAFDLIVSNLGLHWINDLPSMLSQCRTMMKKDGLFLASLIGGNSLIELRSCLLDAEIAETGGASPRFSPLIDLRTAGNVIHHAGFLLPVADSETVTLLYTDIFALMHELRALGQTNAHIDKLRHPTRRAIFERASTFYHERFANAEGLIPASFDILYLHGWT